MRNFILIYNKNINTLNVYENDNNQPQYKGTFKVTSTPNESMIKDLLFSNFIEPTEKWGILFIHGGSEINYLPHCKA